jgi:hypothetical protein
MKSNRLRIGEGERTANRYLGRFNKIGGEEANMPEIDLVNWTIQEAQHLNAERREPIEVNDKSSLDKLLAVLEREPRARTDPEGPVAPIASISATVEQLVARPSSAIVLDTKPVAGSELPAVAPAVSSISAETLTAEPKSALLRAVVEPDIYTARADRDRAVALRWVLRDIKNNRLKWSPVDHDDLSILIEMGLVEMQDGAPMLTNAGASAII